MSFPARFLMVTVPLALALAAQPLLRAGDGTATADEALLALQGKYKTAEKKYEGLAKKIEQAVEEAIASAEWRPAGEGSAPRPLAQHLRRAWIDQLAASAGASKRPSDSAAKLLELFPWREMLELTDGIQYGSDRPIPENENGFIVMGAANPPCSGFPELSINTYLWGLGEIVGWRFRVDDKKSSPRFLGRGPSATSSTTTTRT